jgi:FkbH-like protein
MTVERSRLVLCGTWTQEPLVPVLEFWSDTLRLDPAVQLAPYAQLFQQLLDPASLLRANRAGANVVCVRWEDLLPVGGDGAAVDAGLLASRVDELEAALAGFAHLVPCLVLCGPSDDAACVEATRALAARLSGVANLTVRDGGQAMARYRVERVRDPVSERFGHVPYTPEALAALGTEIARWHAMLARVPPKVFAVDGDHTLWGGVVGEDGVDGVRIEPGHVALQDALARQGRAGKLLCLLSKNEEADVRELFARRGGDMRLAWDDFTAQRVDWNPKPDNLRELVAGLELGLDSVVFLDDNPAECAQMRARSPSTLTVRVPTDPARLATFVEHFWLFDQHVVTEEDRKRAAMYRENAARAALRRDVGSLQSFLDGLGLVVDIDPPAAQDVPRLAQLTQRTNQFNASLLRLREGEVLEQGEGVFHRAVRARDRFGDYGLVGQVRARPVGDRLEVDLFMLSCRALGRGIEHRMLAAAGAHALALGLQEVLVRFSAGERNTPVRRFLEHACGAGPGAVGDAFGFRMPALACAALTFDPTVASSQDPEDEGERAAAAKVADGEPDLGAVYERIAHELTTGAAIERAISGRVGPRPDLATGYMEPAPGLEREIAEIWRQALRIDAVGAQDEFRELGGKSIHLVQVHRLLLERLGIDVDITTLFQHPTVASLAARLSSARAGSAGLDTARQRGRDMREAQARAAAAAAARRQAIANARMRTGA